MYRIEIATLAARMLGNIEPKTRGQIIRKIEQLRNDPERFGKPLVGPLRGLRSLRAAGQRYRIIYRIEDERVVVIIVAVGIRKSGDKRDIYELLKKLIRTGLLGSRD